MPLIPSFHEVRFPLGLAFGASGGPVRHTEVVTLGSGREARNARWSQSRRRFDAGQAVRTLDDLYSVLAFFEERKGKLFGFRFRDPLDFKSGSPAGPVAASDQLLGTGDGTTATFDLVKRYGVDDIAPRRIAKPVAGTVLIAVDGVGKAEGADFTVDTATGAVTFPGGAIPAAGTQVTAGFEFDLPARFDADQLVVNLAAFEAGDIPSVPIVEILP